MDLCGDYMKKIDVIKKIGKERWEEFCDFMVGQTVGWKDEETDFYECDVDNFLNPKNKRFFD